MDIDSESDIEFNDNQIVIGIKLKVEKKFIDERKRKRHCCRVENG